MANKIQENFKHLSKNNYVRKASPSLNYWFDFAKTKIESYKKDFGDNFNLIIYGSPEIEDDFFVLPFSAFKHIFTDAHLAQADRNRWIGSIKFNELRVTNSQLHPDIFAYYANFALLDMKLDNLTEILLRSEEDQNDYAIENRLVEIKARQKQSLFRNRVLSNFDNRCCLTEIGEADLLVASHIVPWSERKESRLDPRNGLCLFVTYDSLFDQGYFSLRDDLSIVLTPQLENLSPKLKQMLTEIQNQKIRLPIKYGINLEYVQFHRQYILKIK